MRYLSGGWTFIELLVTLMLIALLSCSFVGLLRDIQVRHVRADFVRHVASVMHVSRVQALLEHDVLVLEPLNADLNWAMGVRLLSYATQRIIQEWHWRNIDCAFNWRGFQRSDKLLIDGELTRMAMNGHFLMRCPHGVSDNISVSRFGRVH